MKRIISLLLVMLMILSSVFVLSACSDDKDKKDKKDKDKDEDTTQVTTNVSDSEEHIFDDSAECELGTPSKTVDPETVYNSIEYDERMFYGQYRIEGGETAEAEFAENTSLFFNTYKKQRLHKV